MFSLKGQILIAIQYKYMEAQQPTSYLLRHLDAWAHMNEAMDALAKRHWKLQSQIRRFNTIYIKQPWIGSI